MNELIAKIKELSNSLLEDAALQAEKETRQLEHVHVRLLWNWKKC